MEMQSRLGHIRCEQGVYIDCGEKEARSELCCRADCYETSLTLSEQEVYCQVVEQGRPDLILP